MNEKDITLLLQGKINYECINFYLENYKNTKIIISTWENTNLTITNPNVKILKSKIPNENGWLNSNLQFTSTTIGLKYVDTDYVIKLRADEYYSNLLNLVFDFNSHDKILTSPIFFRHFKYPYYYHISDHIIGGLTSNVKLMFKDSNNILNLDDNIGPEIYLTKSYLKNKGFFEFSNLIKGRQIMIDSFDIIDLKRLIPYMAVCNTNKQKWINNFDNDKNNSVKNIIEI